MREETVAREPVKTGPTYSPADPAMDLAWFEANVGDGSIGEGETAPEAPAGEETEGEPRAATPGGETPSTEEPDGSTEETSATEGTEPEAEGAGEETPGKKRDRTAAGRIKELNDRLKATEAEKARLLSLLETTARAPEAPPAAETVREPGEPTAAPDDGAPKPPRRADFIDEATGDFNEDAYDEAAAKHHRDLVRWELDQRDIKARQEAERRSADVRLSTSLERQKAYAEAHPEFGQAVGVFNAHVLSPDGRPRSGQAQDLIDACRFEEDGPALAHHLGEHPEKIAPLLQSRTPRQLWAAIGALRAEMKPQPKPADPAEPTLAELARRTNVSKAPEPVTQMGGKSGVVRKSEDEMSMDEFMRMKGTG